MPGGVSAATGAAANAHGKAMNRTAARYLDIDAGTMRHGAACVNAHCGADRRLERSVPHCGAGDGARLCDNRRVRRSPPLRAAESLPAAALRSAAARLAAAALLAALLTACGEPGQPDRRPLRVYAASSLTDAFTAIAPAFEAAHGGIDVVTAFAGSQVLRLQIEQGAPADLFASADPGHTRALIDAGLLRGARRFAANELAVIVPPDNPAGIEAFADLAAAERLVIGSETAPVGRYTRTALHRSAAALGADFAAAVLSRVVSLETNVRLVRTKVEMGEADAGIVYRTDAAASTRVRTVPIPAALNVRAEYVIGIVTGGGGSDAPGGAGPAERLIAFLRSPPGRAILDRHGFLTP